MIETTRRNLEGLETRLRSLAGRMGDVSSDEVGDMMDKEMKSMDKAIAAAAAKIQVSTFTIRLHWSDTRVNITIRPRILKSRG